MRPSFRKKEEDEERNPHASWSVFGDNKSFVRPEPPKNDKKPEKKERNGKTEQRNGRNDRSDRNRDNGRNRDRERNSGRDQRNDWKPRMLTLSTDIPM